MTPEQLSKKRVWFVLIVVYFILGYFFCNLLNIHRAHYFDVSLPFESKIPFMPFFIVGYLSVYLCIILLYVLTDDYEVIRKAVSFFFIVSTVHFVLFLLFPVKMIRPDINDTSNFMSLLTHQYYKLDYPVNCFPSLHVSYPLAGTLVMWNYKRKWGYVFAALTAFIAVSVVLVKQHYILDVVGAIVVTGIVYTILKCSSKL